MEESDRHGNTGRHLHFIATVTGARPDHAPNVSPSNNLFPPNARESALLCRYENTGPWKTWLCLKSRSDLLQASFFTEFFLITSQDPLSTSSRQPPRQSSSHQTSKLPEKESNMTVIPSTSLGNDPTTRKWVIGYVTVSHEDDGQTGPARKSTSSDIEMRDVAHRAIGTMTHYRFSPFLRVPLGSPRPLDRMYPHAACQIVPSSSPPPPNRIHPKLVPTNVIGTGAVTRWTSYLSTPLPPPLHRRLLDATRARLRNGEDTSS
ncbi:hypothetical protein H4582DRAFT_1958373 [Lactarius indigo]|nr:hypothetical protein H4582DRAFT_1958373 [Lactarius indigo]